MARKADLAKALRERNEERESSDEDFLSTGATILNLGFTGHPKRGYKKGLCYSFVGDSSSGKTVLALSALAEASIDPHFKEYSLEFIDQEGGALMDFERYYGRKAAERIHTWRADSLEDYYYQISKIKGPFVGVTDSMDALWTEDDEEQLEKIANAREKGKEATGSYGTSKAKTNSSSLRMLSNQLRDTGSIMILISQTRDNIGFGSMFKRKTYSGGHAIQFYSRIQLWTSIREIIKARIKKKERQIGIRSQIKITKNHITGWQGNLEVPILRGYGIDDVGSIIDWLVEEKHWSVKKGAIDAQELGEEAGRDGLIQYIIDNEMEKDLIDIVAGVWDEIEEESKDRTRKPRYE